jgi:hypothetical protein
MFASPAIASAGAAPEELRLLRVDPSRLVLIFIIFYFLLIRPSSGG